MLPPRYLKLRLDRVLLGELSGSLADVTASGGPVAPFPKPASWTAPYNKYAQARFRRRTLLFSGAALTRYAGLVGHVHREGVGRGLLCWSWTAQPQQSK